MTLLRIDSSARKSSVSRQLTAEFVKTWKRENPEGKVVERDLAETTLPLITDEWVAGAHSKPEALTAGQSQAISHSNALVVELQRADTIVIGAPMYNFAISAPLKGWIDQVVRNGHTWTMNGPMPEGLLRRKQVVVVTSRGGAYRPGTPTAGFDFQEPYLRFVLGFIGLTDVTFIHAENQKPGDVGATALAAAMEQVRVAAENSVAEAAGARA
jgi:FMN-dependent NADH-azoreductase